MVGLHDSTAHLGLSKKVNSILRHNRVTTIAALIEAIKDGKLIYMTGRRQLEALSLADVARIEVILSHHGFGPLLPTNTYVLELGLSKRAENLLVRAGILTVEQLRHTVMQDVATLYGVGQKTLDEIRSCLESFAAHPRVDIQKSLQSRASSRRDTLVEDWVVVVDRLTEETSRGRLHGNLTIAGDTLKHWLKTDPSVISSRHLGRAVALIGKGLKHTTVADELSALFSGQPSKYIEIFAHRLIPLVSHRLTLQQLGDKWNITRERIRQIMSKVSRQVEYLLQTEPLLYCQSALVIAEQMGEDLRFDDWLHRINERGILGKWDDLTSKRFPDTISPLDLLLTISNPRSPQAFQPRFPLPANLQLVLEEVTLSARQVQLRKTLQFEPDKLRKIRKQVRNGGAISVTQAINELCLSEQDAGLILEMFGLHRIADDWYTILMSAKASTLDRHWSAFHIVLKMMKICEKLDVKEVYRGLHRHCQKFGYDVPPPAILSKVLRTYGFTVENDCVEWSGENASTVSSGEQIILGSLRATGPVVGFFELAQAFKESGKSLPLLSVTLRYSPLFSRIRPGLYKLRGTNVTQGEIQEASERQPETDSNFEIVYEISGDINVILNLGATAIATGVISSPHLDALHGRWQLAARGQAFGNARIENKYMWGLLKALHAVDARLGDRVMLKFDPIKRDVTLSKDHDA